jgi:hypothetical protein
MQDDELLAKRPPDDQQRFDQLVENLPDLAVLLFAISLAKGAQTIVYLASSPDVAKTTGQYFYESIPAIPSSWAQDDAGASFPIGVATTGGRKPINAKCETVSTFRFQSHPHRGASRISNIQLRLGSRSYCVRRVRGRVTPGRSDGCAGSPAGLGSARRSIAADSCGRGCRARPCLPGWRNVAVRCFG